MRLRGSKTKSKACQEQSSGNSCLGARKLAPKALWVIGRRLRGLLGNRDTFFRFSSASLSFRSSPLRLPSCPPFPQLFSLLSFHISLPPLHMSRSPSSSSFLLFLPARLPGQERPRWRPQRRPQRLTSSRRRPLPFPALSPPPPKPAGGVGRRRRAEGGASFSLEAKLLKPRRFPHHLPAEGAGRARERRERIGGIRKRPFLLARRWET